MTLKAACLINDSEAACITSTQPASKHFLLGCHYFKQLLQKGWMSNGAYAARGLLTIMGHVGDNVFITRHGEAVLAAEMS